MPFRLLFGVLLALVLACPAAGAQAEATAATQADAAAATTQAEQPVAGAHTEQPVADEATAPAPEQPYPVGSGGRYPAPGFDPGRRRDIPHMQSVYGQDVKTVRANCVRVDFLGHKVLFNRQAGAAQALTRVAARLRAHLQQHPADKAYILPLAGTFYWRVVKDTGQLSAHSFAIAIDLNQDKGLYWLWKPTPEQVEAVRRDYPQAIVDAFEAEGFIWGGKWSAFDFMHFEYRPELLPPRQGD